MNNGNRIWSVVPVKRFAIAKSRLSPVLDAEERATLTRLMFEDVLDVLLQSTGMLAGVAVVTSDTDAAALARIRGATVVPDRDDDGINAAVRMAIAQVASEEDGVIVVPADIPQLTPGAIAVAAETIALPGTMAIAASNDGGTNLLACRPAGAISLHFGPHSFELHCRAAEHGRLTVQALNLLDLLFDIDSPDDLRRFVVLESRTRAHEFLSRLGIIDRLERRDVPPTADRVAAGASS